jgi:hypothetical protein
MMRAPRCCSPYCSRQTCPARKRVFLQQFCEPPRDRVRARRVGLLALPQERPHSRRESAAEPLRLEGVDVRAVEAGEDIVGKVVVPARLHRRKLVTQAGERERVVSHRADVVLGLPEAAPLDTRARMECIDDDPAEEVCGRRRLRRARRFGGVAEQQPEARTAGGEARRRGGSATGRIGARPAAGTRVDRRRALEVDEVHGVQLVGERAGPVLENLGNRHVVGDGEGEVKVREAIAAAERQRPDSGSGNDPFVVLGKRQHAFAQHVPLLDREHDRGS